MPAFAVTLGAFLLKKSLGNRQTNMFLILFLCLIWDLGQFGMGHRIRTEILSRTHLLNVDLANFLDFYFFYTKRVSKVAFRVHITLARVPGKGLRGFFFLRNITF